MPVQPSGTPSSRPSQRIVTSSNSVAAGDVRHSIALTSSVAASASARIATGAALVAKYAKKRGMVPVGRCRHDDALEVVEDALERIRRVRAPRSGSRRRTSPGRTSA